MLSCLRPKLLSFYSGQYLHAELHLLYEAHLHQRPNCYLLLRVYRSQLHEVVYFVQIHVVQKLSGPAALRAIDVRCPRPYLGNLFCSGVCPPSKRTCGPPPVLAQCPFMPLPDVFLYSRIPTPYSKQDLFRGVWQCISRLGCRGGN